jgi:hypothetical protein
MCTGRPPFEGDSTLATIRAVCDVESPSIRSLNPEVPAWLEGIIRKLLAKDPARRFQSAAQVEELLAQCLAHVQQPGQVPLPPGARELGRQAGGAGAGWAHRRCVSAAVAVVGLSGAAACFLALSGRPPDAGAPVRGNTGSEVASEPDPAGLAALENEFSLGTGRVRVWLGGMAWSFSADAEPAPGGSGLDNVRRRADALRADFGGGEMPSPDPVAAGLQAIRRRLEALGQRVDGRLD